MSPQTNDTSLVKACPVCMRVIWTNSVCYHGQIPPPDKSAPKELPLTVDDDDPPILRKKTRDKK